MSKRPTALPVNEGSDGVLDLSGKAQAYMRLAAEHAQRAAKTTDPKLAVSFLDLAKGYRELAIKTTAPTRWRARPPTIDKSGQEMAVEDIVLVLSLTGFDPEADFRHAVQTAR